MTDFDSNKVYATPSSDLIDSKNAKQQFEKFNAEKKRLKKNNMVSAIIFVAYGVLLYFACSEISILIAGAGKVYNVPGGDVLKAIEPYKNLQSSIMPFVIVGLVAYLNFIFGKVKVGIYIIFLSMIMLFLMLYRMNTNFMIQDLFYIFIIAPLILVELNTIRINYYKNKMLLNLAKNLDNGKANNF